MAFEDFYKADGHVPEIRGIQRIFLDLWRPCMKGKKRGKRGQIYFHENKSVPNAASLSEKAVILDISTQSQSAEILAGSGLYGMLSSWQDCRNDPNSLKEAALKSVPFSQIARLNARPHRRLLRC